MEVFGPTLAVLRGGLGIVLECFGLFVNETARNLEDFGVTSE